MMIRSLNSLANNTPIEYRGHSLLKVAHPTLGFAARTGNGQTVVLTGKTQVLVAKKPTYGIDATAIVATVSKIGQMVA